MTDPSATPLHGSRAPSLGEVGSWIGWRVDDLNSSMLGHVERVIGDGYGGPAWLVIAEFRLGDGRRFLVPAFDAVGSGGRVWSPHLPRRCGRRPAWPAARRRRRRPTACCACTTRRVQPVGSPRENLSKFP